MDKLETLKGVYRQLNPAYQPIRINTENIRGVWRVLLRMIQ